MSKKGKTPKSVNLGIVLAGGLVGVIGGVIQAKSPGLWPTTKLNNTPTRPQTIAVTLLASGSHENGVSARLPKEMCDGTRSGGEGAALAAWAAKQLGGFEGSDDCRGCTLYDATARRIESCADVAETAVSMSSTSKAAAGVSAALPTGDMVETSLWVVRPDKWFVFPSGELGRAVAVPRVSPPRGKAHPITVETISSSPRVFHLHNFITEAESDSLVAYALANTDPVLGLQRSTTGAEHQVSFNKVRTSENAFDSVSPTARAVKKRAIQLLGMEPYDDEMTDGLQVLRYNTSKAYIPHLDFLEDNGSGHDYDAQEQGSNRFATILFYLSDVDEGGETVFTEGQPVEDGRVDALDGVAPRAGGREDSRAVVRAMKDGTYYDRPGRRYNNGSEVPVGRRPSADPFAIFEPGSWEETMVGQCRGALAVRPMKAHAVLFYSQFPDGSLDRSSRHGGCPVLAGTKWAANLWIWNKVRLGYSRAPRKSGAEAFDASRGIGRDRMSKKTTAGGPAPPPGGQPKQPVAIFENMDVPGAQLYYAGTTHMGALAVGQTLRYNSYAGHEWAVKDASGKVLVKYTVDSRPEQLVTVSKNSGKGKPPSSTPVRAPKWAHPPM